MSISNTLMRKDSIILLKKSYDSHSVFWFYKHFLSTNTIYSNSRTQNYIMWGLLLYWLCNLFVQLRKKFSFAKNICTYIILPFFFHFSIFPPLLKGFRLRYWNFSFRWQEFRLEMGFKRDLILYEFIKSNLQACYRTMFHNEFSY